MLIRLAMLKILIKILFLKNLTYPFLLTYPSLLSSFAEVVMSCVTENRDVSSGNDFALEDKSHKLFM